MPGDSWCGGLFSEPLSRSLLTKPIQGVAESSTSFCATTSVKVAALPGSWHFQLHPHQRKFPQLGLSLLLQLSRVSAVPKLAASLG